MRALVQRKKSLARSEAQEQTQTCSPFAASTVHTPAVCQHQTLAVRSPLFTLQTRLEALTMMLVALKVCCQSEDKEEAVSYTHLRAHETEADL
eukprot:3718199-Amphidinium_carterae.1